MAYHSEPWNMSPRELESWYKRNIEDGSTSFAAESNKSMDRLVRSLHNIRTVNIKEVRKAGSMQKGTYYKDGSDIDCIVILGGIPQLSNRIRPEVHQQEHLKPNLRKILTALRSGENASFVATVEEVSNLQLKVGARQDRGPILEIDILLTADNLNYDLLNKRMLEDHYNYILGMSSKEQRFTYQPCLTPLQTEFVKSQPSNVKSLIRLLKYWKAEYLHKRYGYTKLINSYTLELVAIHVYENMGSPSSFNMGVGFKRVMLLLASGLDSLKCYWTNNYTREMAEKGVRRIQTTSYRNYVPILLDPSDPSDNVFERWLDGLGKIKQAARDTLNTRLMREI